MECRVMADENAFQYRIEKLELQWEHYEASGQFTADVVEQMEKLMRNPEWFWEGIGFDGFDRYIPENKRGEAQEELMTAFVNNDYFAVGQHFIKQLEHYVYDAALNNIPGPD